MSSLARITLGRLVPSSASGPGFDSGFSPGFEVEQSQVSGQPPGGFMEATLGGSALAPELGPAINASVLSGAISAIVANGPVAEVNGGEVTSSLNARITAEVE